MDVSRDFIERLIFEKEKRRRVVRLVSVSCSNMLQPGENFCSQLIRLNLTLELGSGELEERSLVLKRRLRESLENLNVMFDTEILMFEEFLPLLKKNLNKCLKPGEESLWADFYAADKDNILLEDLTECGYRTLDRTLPMDMDHVLLVIQGLAKLHTASKVAMASGRMNPALLPECVIFREKSFTDPFHKNLWTSVLPHFQSNCKRWLEVVKKLSSIDNFGRRTAALRTKDPEELLVLNHGDLWRNNLMFKFQGKRPVGVKLVDLQLSHYSSLGWDLSYFLYCSLEPSQWEEWIPRMLDAYRQELVVSLESMCHTSQPPPTLLQLQDELSRLSLFSLLASCALSVFTLNTKKENVNVEDVILGDSEGNMYTNPRVLDIIPQIFSYFHKSGHLETLFD